MTVKELKEKLASIPDDVEVHIAYNYGDYWRTIVAPNLRKVSMEEVVHSAYHEMDKLVIDVDYEEGIRQVLVLR